MGKQHWRASRPSYGVNEARAELLAVRAALCDTPRPRTDRGALRGCAAALQAAYHSPGSHVDLITGARSRPAGARSLLARLPR